MIVGIVGCGAIANTIVNEFISDSGIQIKYFYDTDIERAENLAQIANGVAVLRLEDMLDDVDLILESASPIALKVIALDILERGIDLMVMSVGALMDKEFRNKVRKTISEASLTTRKAPKSLGREVEEEEILFEGKASEAVEKFPVNINVAASLSIACNMDIDVKIIVDPKVDRNVHEVVVKGDFGEFRTSSENYPFAANPKTSMLAAFSAIKLLKSFGECFSVGT